MTTVEPKRGLSILVVEDEESIGALLVSVLGMEAHRVRVSQTGQGGMQQFDTEASDIVITDLGLPDHSGWEVAQHVKRSRPGTPVILITGWGYTASEAELQRRGVDCVLHKPFEFEELWRAISRVWKGKSPSCP